MSVIIDIADDGHITATHNSGQVLWEQQVDESRFEEPLDESIALFVEDAVR
ncbi:hypothetical protein ACFQE1_02085 [Halobium palmae]|uniref:Uncharacterized protein n=1 Tax=Halobium palmae TaxID=1776492 RepID=A0ABD5RVA8_9EURY